MEKPKNERIAAIDLIRGYFLFVIIIDHLGRFFGFYEIFTGAGRQWVSAAEGFFFVSGLMIGLVRGRKLLDKPLKVAARKVWSRALQLYLWSIGLTVFFTLIAWTFMGNPGLKAGAFYNEPITHFITTTLTLRYTYGWADFLAYYVIYLVFTPFALWLLRKKLWFVLLGLNLLIWLRADNIQIAWQLLFFSGTIVGFYLSDIESWFKNLTKRTRQIIATTTIGLGVLSIGVSLFMNTAIDLMNRTSNAINPLGSLTPMLYELNRDHLAHYFDKYSLGIGRLILFYIWFTMLYLLVRRYETPLKKYLGWFFIPLGQNSLYVYIVHAITVFFLDLYVTRPLPIWLNIIINTVVLAAIWTLVKTKFLFRIIPR